MVCRFFVFFVVSKLSAMKKNLFILLLLTLTSVVKAQNFGAIDAILDRLEERNGIGQNLKDIDISGKKFVNIKDFEDHTERMFLSVIGDKATYIEIFDDKATGESVSNVFSGDVIRTNNNILSFRFTKLENQPINFPITKMLLMTTQKKILYLVDVNTKERWVDEVAVND